MNRVYVMGRSFEVPCTVEIEHTPESLHAWVELDGEIEILPGDKVIVHDAPAQIAPGEKRTLRCRATVTRASWLDRQWVRLMSRFELTELYDVNFTSRRVL